MKHLLLIEDNNEIRENTAEILELAGYKIVTAKAERTDFRKGMEMGADDYITKPFSDVELLGAIDSRLKKMELVKKNYEANAEGMRQMLDEFGGRKTLTDLTQDRNTNNYKKKQVIYMEGNHPSRLFYIVSGKVKTYKTNNDGKELTVGLFNDGDFLGYTALLEASAYKETAEAIEDTELAIIPKEEFESLINSSKEVTHKFIQLLAKNVSEKEEQLLGLAYNSLRKRVADALMTLQHKYQTTGQEKFSMHISREDLANIAGTATESLIRTLSDFKSEKLIEIKDGNIVILNEKKLAAMLN